MAVKSGELLHLGNTILVDRAQTAGPGTINIPTEKIYELGNYESIATVRDIPDLSFNLESLDVSAEMECMLLGVDFPSAAQGTALPLANCLPMDIASLFKRGRTDANPFDVAASVAIPYLTCESISYRFGLGQSAAQTVNLKGDSIFYSGGSAYVQSATGSNTANQAVVLTNLVIPYNGDVIAGVKYALGVSLKSGQRLVFGVDYTEVATGAGASKAVTVTVLVAVPVTDSIRIIYQSTVAANYPQNVHAAATATRPAAIKGRSIEIRIGGVTVTDRWSSVQSVTVEQRLSLLKDEEFGNSQLVAQDYDIPVVSGTVEIKPRNAAELLTRIRQIAGVVSTTEVVGPFQTVALPLEVLLHSPDTGAVLKTIFIPDARFTMPGYSGRVQQKLTLSFPFDSDGGTLIVYKGQKP